MYLRRHRIAVLAYLNVGCSALLSVAPPAAAEAEVREHVAERVRAAAALGAFKAFLSVLVVRIPSNTIVRSRKGVGKGCIDVSAVSSCVDKNGRQRGALFGHVRRTRKRSSTSNA